MFVCGSFVLPTVVTKLVASKMTEFGLNSALEGRMHNEFLGLLLIGFLLLLI